MGQPEAVVKQTLPLSRADIERILAVWIERLGLTGWDIVIRWDQPVEKPEGGEAEIRVHPDYEQASIRIKETFAQDWGWRNANVTLVHELLHIFERGTNRTIQSLEGAIPSAAYLVVWDRYEHEAEGWVDRLANLLVDLVGLA